MRVVILFSTIYIAEAFTGYLIPPSGQGILAWLFLYALIMDCWKK